jgi:hypothetical protein
VSVIVTSSRCFTKHKAVSHRTVERRKPGNARVVTANARG